MNYRACCEASGRAWREPNRRFGPIPGREKYLDLMTIASDDELTKITLRAEAKRSVGRQRFRLAVERGADSSSELISSEDRALIGRSPQADLVINDPFVSRMHCEVATEEGVYILRDLGSINR